MAEFVAGRIHLQVATAMNEAGVDLPNAPLMVIDHTERFGLAQFHQLRGRVGRGVAESACSLPYQRPLSVGARATGDRMLEEMPERAAAHVERWTAGRVELLKV